MNFAIAAVLAGSVLACWTGGAFGQYSDYPKPVYSKSTLQELYDQQARGTPTSPPTSLLTLLTLLTPPSKTIVGVSVNDATAICGKKPVWACGGKTQEHVEHWKSIANRGDEVEIRGACYSACTLVMSFVGKDKLCFSKNAMLAFHMNRMDPANTWAPGMKLDHFPPSLEGSRRVVDSYPENIRLWIDAKGGYAKLPLRGYWTLSASELWRMGYRKCAD